MPKQALKVLQQGDVPNSINTKAMRERNEFLPTKKMKRWLKTTIEQDLTEVVEIAKATGINRNSWYAWTRNPLFIQWFNQEWQKALDSHAYKLDIIGIKKATENYKYWEAMQKRSGRLQETPAVQQNIGVQGDFNVDFIVDKPSSDNP